MSSEPLLRSRGLGGVGKSAAAGAELLVGSAWGSGVKSGTSMARPLGCAPLHAASEQRRPRQHGTTAGSRRCARVEKTTKYAHMNVLAAKPCTTAHLGVWGPAAVSRVVGGGGATARARGGRAGNVHSARLSIRDDGAQGVQTSHVHLRRILRAQMPVRLRHARPPRVHLNLPPPLQRLLAALQSATTGYG